VKIALFLSDKERERKIGDALSAGFKLHGDEVRVISTQDFDTDKGDGAQLAVMVGVKGRSKEIFEYFRRSGRHTLLIDKSYFDRGEYYRVSLDGFQPHYAHAKPRSRDRLLSFDINLAPMRKSGKHIIYAGSSQKYCNWHDIGDASAFAADTCFKIRKLTKNSFPIYYRPKPSWAAMHPDEVVPVKDTIFSGPQESLKDRLHDCHALVTHGSNAAIEALISGIPVVLVSTEGACAAWPLAGHVLDGDIMAPPIPTDAQRMQLFADLAWCQFTLEEMAAGLAWETLLDKTIKRYQGTPSAIEQYRIMHQGAKVFRGNSLKGHIDTVGKLIEAHKPADLLDYGSGKGLQYEDLALHQRWGGLKPTCYDPGYEPLSKKPDYKFDGVICTDVAEHIDEPEVPEFLDDVCGYAKKFVFFCIYTGPASKFLPDGRNCHLTQRPESWWLDQIRTVTGAEITEEFMVTKYVPGGTQDFLHFRMKTLAGVEIVVTFRGNE
jgi:hypothetical protein